MPKRLICAATLSSMALLGGCYESDGDLLGDQKEHIILADPVFGYNGVVAYLDGVGDTVKLCTAETKTQLQAGCTPIATLSVERTPMGNYILQKSKIGRGFEYGIWYRSHEGKGGASGRQCVEWIGERIIGRSAELGTPLGPSYAQFVSQVTRIAPTTLINRKQLDALVLAYESRFHVDGTCLGSWIIIDQKSVVIDGDRRHLRAFD